MKNSFYQILIRPRTKRVDIMRRSIPSTEWHHIATCESLEIARGLVTLMNIGVNVVEPVPVPKKRAKKK